MSIESRITIDGAPVPFEPGQTILQAAQAAGVFIPHLCHHPDFAPHGSCKLCMVTVNGRDAAACTLPATPGQEVRSDAPEINARRRLILQMLFVDGNHFCPACDKSGACKLQALGYELEMLNDHFPHYFPHREIDASHPDILLDANRCIMCELCVRASRDFDGKDVFALVGRGRASHIVANAPSGKLGDTDLSIEDKAAHVCPVGAIMPKRIGFAQPIGARPYDHESIRRKAETHHEFPAPTARAEP